jgi:hypothetical protein
MKRLFLASLALISASAYAQPLTSQPVKQYECLINKFQPVLGYFNPRMPPDPIPYSTNPVIVCHDDRQHGPYDTNTVPRRNEKLATFKVWDATNPMFYDMDGDGRMDVHGNIIRGARNGGLNIPATTNFFHKLSVRNHELGFIMAPFVDTTTFKSYCPSAVHYNSANPMFRSMRDIVSVDTEGLYMGQRMRGDRDFVYVSESVLKKTWFHVINNRPTFPNDNTVSSNAIFFVHDGDVFQIKGYQELNLPGQRVFTINAGGVESSYPTHDRKIGCVPTI